MRSLSDESRRQAMDSLDQVGAAKSVGYLPLRTITSNLGQDIEQLKSHYEGAGLQVKIFPPEATCIYSGAFFVYDRRQVEQAIEKFKSQIARSEWRSDPDPEYVIDQIAANWFEEDHPIRELISFLYGP
jgi:hypothetical protein